jgi:5-formyltetrahydrofolate cyclo-ligase
VIPPDDLRRRKRELRARVRALRDALPPEDRARRSRSVADRLLGLPELEGGGTVALFSTFGSEIETDVILERLVARGWRVALPRVEHGEIVAIRYRPGDPVRTANFGASEPLGDETVAPAAIDVVVTPGLAFDRGGYRVGYGGGFYDRFLRRTRADTFKVAVCFALQVVSEVPRAGGDMPVDAIVTEEVTIRCG